MPASGTPYTIAAHGYEASLASVGASLRSLRHHGRDLVVPFAADELRPALRGAVLAPWPNRLADGRYPFAGAVHRLPLNEPETGNAAHGLVAWSAFDAMHEAPDRVVLAGWIEPQPGYPWRVRIEVETSLDENGLRQRITATNESAEPAPIGLGAHPYLLAGACAQDAVDEWRLQVPADEVLLVTADRMLPLETVSVADHDAGVFDFRSPRRIGGTALNHAFTALRSDDDGWARIRVRGPDGHGVQLSWPTAAPWVQLYTADHAEGETRRHAIAVEPMTCPPDAFNSGRDLRILASGADTQLEWRLQAL